MYSCHAVLLTPIWHRVRLCSEHPDWQPGPAWAQEGQEADTQGSLPLPASSSCEALTELPGHLTGFHTFPINGQDMRLPTRGHTPQAPHCPTWLELTLLGTPRQCMAATGAAAQTLGVLA